MFHHILLLLSLTPSSSFFDYSDPTHGMITYVSATEAYSSGLAYVQGDGVAIMTVDTNSTLSSGAYRKSYGARRVPAPHSFSFRVRITTKKSYNKGLFVFDILRGPYGCAVWPAAWLVGPNWPSGGEIDVGRIPGLPVLSLTLPR
jgi:hypothetical protein